MMIDSQAEFSDAQAVTATAISTNVMDLGAMTDQAGNTRDIGTGEPVYLVVLTNTTATDTSSDATLAVTLESATDAGLTSGAVVHVSTGTLAFATYATANTVVLAVRLPAGSYKRFMGIRYTVAAGPLTAGAFDAFLTSDAQLYRAYADRQPIAAAA